MIIVFYVWWPFVTWSWPWTELSIKHLLDQYLVLYFRSIWSKFWPKTCNFEVSTARNLKAPISTFDLTLTWHVTSFEKFRGWFRIVSSRAFERRLARLCGHSFASYDVGAFRRLTSSPSPASRGWRNIPATAGLTRAPLGYSAERAPLGGIFCPPPLLPIPLLNSRSNRRSEAGEAAIESPEREDSNAH